MFSQLFSLLLIYSSTHLLINYYAIPNITLICPHYIPSIQTPNIFQSHHDYTIEGTSILAEKTNTKCYRIDPLRGKCKYLEYSYERASVNPLL